MNQIDNLSDDADQVTNVVLADGSAVKIELFYMPAIQRWTMDVTYGSREFLGLNLCIHPNILRPWRHLLPFGIACTTIDGADPLYIQDFSSGRVSLFILDETEVQEIEDEVFAPA